MEKVQVLRAGEEGFLGCSAIGLPEPRIVWYFSKDATGMRADSADASKELPQQGKYLEGIWILKLVDLSPVTHNGFWTCIVTNACGQLSFTYSLTIQGEGRA